MRKTRKPLAAAIALALVAALGAGATLAWLTDEESVTNTFTVGNIGIALDETETGVDADDEADAKANEYKMIPGVSVAKDPVITIEKGSEDCWLFVKITEGAVVGIDAEGKEVEYQTSDFVKYEADPSNWVALGDSYPGVYTLKIGAARDVVQDRLVKVLGYTDEDGAFHANEVQIRDTVTKEMMDALEAEGATLPKLTFTAYAVQMAGFDSAAEAWAATFGA